MAMARPTSSAEARLPERRTSLPVASAWMSEEASWRSEAMRPLTVLLREKPSAEGVDVGVKAEALEDVRVIGVPLSRSF